MATVKKNSTEVKTPTAIVQSFFFLSLFLSGLFVETRKAESVCFLRTFKVPYTGFV